MDLLGMLTGSMTSDASVNALSKKTGASSGQTGASSAQVQSLLNNMAPAMMSGVSAAATNASQATEENPMDLGSLMGMFGGSEASSSSQSDMLSGLLGGSSPLSGGSLLEGGTSQADASAFNGSSLMSLLGGMMK